MQSEKSIDLITIGRSSVDLYGRQIGGRLEDMGSFNKYIGGSPTNIAAGAARLGLRSGLITRVGNEHFGRFIREQLIREGVNVSGVVTDRDRLTALAILGIRDDTSFPLLFYRENCADMALCEDDIDPHFICKTRCLCATGTHLSHPNTEAAVRKAVYLAKENGSRTALDIDYRPNLWGLGDHDSGEHRYVASSLVTNQLQASLAIFDLIVGTEEEIHIAGGSTDTLEALVNIRNVTSATLVCKRGPLGATVFPEDIPSSLDEGISGEGFPVEVFNVLGAGDGFMAGLLKAWLDDEEWPNAIRIANACGAFAVSRHGCTPSYPSKVELDYFLATGVKNPALRNDSKLEHIHWSTNRSLEWPVLRIFAFDHRSQFEAMVNGPQDFSKIARFKELCLKSVLQTQQGQVGFGVLCDQRFGRQTLNEAAGSGLWIGCPVEYPGSRPLFLEPELGLDYGKLQEWPLEYVVKVLCHSHPEDDETLWQQQLDVISRLFVATRRAHLELLVEIILDDCFSVDESSCSKVISRIYESGVCPDWWKLEPMKTPAEWDQVSRTIESEDPYCRGIVILGKGSHEEDLFDSFNIAAPNRLVKGFAVGRTIFADTAKRWFAGDLRDEEAITLMADRFITLCQKWDEACEKHRS